MEFWADLWKKIETVIVDRRFWMAAILVVANFAGVPQLIDNADEVAVNITQLIVAAVGVLGLLYSWTQRPPSGRKGWAGAIEEGRVVFDQFLAELRNLVEMNKDESA